MDCGKPWIDAPKSCGELAQNTSTLVPPSEIQAQYVWKEYMNLHFQSVSEGIPKYTEPLLRRLSIDST